MADQHEVKAMFNDIASHYDFLNHFLSFQLDIIWRKKTSKAISRKHPLTILDVATGTADLAIQMAKDNPKAYITGIDFSEKMIAIGKEKIKKQKLDHRIQLFVAGAEHLPFPDQHFDAVTCAFGVRNFENPSAGLLEMKRVTKEEGLISILEFSQPTSPAMALAYRCYSKHLLPKIGHLISGHQTAYTYLPTSITAFSEANALADGLSASGLVIQHATSLCGGIATIYECIKKSGASSQ